MSHFTVMVVAQDTDAALQPFHEFECTGENDQYVQDIDKTEEMLEAIAGGATIENALGEYGLEDRIVSDESEVKKEGDDCAHKYGYAIVKDGKLVKAVRRTNPNKKWDWWQLGGRWSGKLVMKNGQRADEALAGDVDWSAMIAKASDRAANQYDKIKAIVGDRQVTTWAELLKKHEAGEMTIEAAREFYHEQPAIKELKDAEAHDFFDGAETLSKVMATGRDDYIKRESETNATTWAMLHDGVWHERGRMGWFGMSDDTAESTDGFVTKFWETMRALPADAKVAVVDCHI
jgi:hypothetical protein